MTKADKIEKLKKYSKDLKKELKALQENIQELTKQNFNSSNLIIYLSVWNAYGRENIALYSWDEKENKLDYQKQWSTMPVLGIEYEF